MKLSIFTTITNPAWRSDNYEEALKCYEELADELVVVNGGITDHEQNIINNKSTRTLFYKWPQEFPWEFIGQQFQRGYEACTGDWVIHADLDYIFHEKDFAAIREACSVNSEAPALSFWKYQFVLPDRYNLKSRLVIAVNKGKFGDRIRFDSGGDACQPSLDGQYISPSDVPEARIPFYNYEKILKTKEQIMDDCGRMERASQRSYGKTRYNSDGTDIDGYNKWYEAQRGKLNKPHQHIKLTEHPKYMQETIKNLQAHQFGYNGFGLIEGKVYV